MAAIARHDAAHAERARRVDQAIHAGGMEGLAATPETRANAGEYLAGDITAEEMMARIQGRIQQRRSD